MNTASIVKNVLFSFLALCLFHSLSFAFPTSGQYVQLKDTDLGTTAGGEFEVFTAGSETGTYASSYFSFCVEMTHSIRLNTPYEIASVSDNVTGGGPGYEGANTPGYDTLSDATQWLVYTYFFGSFTYTNSTYGTFTFSRGDEHLTDIVQNLIWFLEEEQNWDSLNCWTKLFYGLFVDGQYSALYNDYVTAINLVDAAGNDMQSQIIAEQAPVPEPETMLLFGTGLIGLASIARRRTNR